MGCKAGQCNRTSTPSQGSFIVILLPEGWPTKAKEALSPNEVRLTLLYFTNPVFQCLGEDIDGFPN